MTRVLITTAVFIALVVLAAHSVSAHPAWGIVIDRNNQIYFSDIETVWKLDAQGKLTVFRAGVSGRHVHEITLGEDGNLYGVDNGYEPSTQRFSAALWKITPEGKFSYVLPPTFNPPKAMTNWKDRAGNSYYVGQSDNAVHDIFVLKRGPDGKVITLAGNQKSGDEFRQVALYSLGGMAFGSDGTLYFTDNSNVRKVTSAGSMTSLAGNLPVENRADSPIPDSQFTRLFGIAVDPQGSSFVADYGNRRILKITPDGKSTTVLSEEKPWSPTGVALKDGNLYVLEFGFTPPSTYIPRVRKLASDGKITTLATVGENTNPVVGQSTSGGTSESPRFGRAYLLLAGIGILALTLVIWRSRRTRPGNEI
jgi:sugar lactone lactonase YvrE